MDIVKKIKELTDERGWTIYQLSSEADIGQSTLSNMFTRGTLPSITTLKKLCDAFGITVSQFFQENELFEMLNEQELELLIEYRKLPKSKQKDLLSFLKK